MRKIAYPLTPKGPCSFLKFYHFLVMLSERQLYLLIGIHVENFTVEVQKGLSHETVHQFSEQSTVYIT